MYEGLTDEQIVALAQGGDSAAMDYLLIKFERIVKICTRTYYLQGADREDVVQEGMMGLLNAIRAYKPDRDSSFRSFADVCIRRHMNTVVTAYTRDKYKPLNTAQSLNEPLYGVEGGRTLLETAELAGAPSNPESLFITKEHFDEMLTRFFKLLTPLEREVAVRYAQGKSYRQICAEIGRHSKCVDNAVQRVKFKLKKSMEAEEQS